MKAPARNSAWNRDELTLALDLYVKTHDNPTGSNFALGGQVSGESNKLQAQPFG